MVSYHIDALYNPYYRDLNDFFARTSGNYHYLTTKGGCAYTDTVCEGSTFLMFGREDAARSLNLSNSVAITAYEVLRQWGF